MASTIHSNARTTPQIRRELQEAPPGVSDPELARRYGITRMTVRKWRYRNEVEDRSHCPQRLHTTLTPEQEAIVVQVREVALLSLDDLLIVAREFLNPELSRAALARCLRRHGVGDLRALQRERDGEPEEPAHKPFKDYVPGFVHVDVKYLPQMADQASRGYLFVAIDRASRWVYLDVRRTKSAEAARGFLKKLLEKAPFQITHLVTDNGKEFTDRFAATGEREPTGHHPFDRLCAEHGIEHRLIRPKRPQTNGMVERFNGRIADLLRTRHFDSGQHLDEALRHYQRLYNHHIGQKALGHRTPVETLKAWQHERPDLFRKRVYDQTRPDTYS
ncbi:IS481 family transposase [Thioalkalivibrio sp. ALE17]|uniref:IS481 family transposase n=1 Tax=Thioalkalivibrio sp. ALE17 TaxID=1158173 RepID=UPI0004917AAC|nr:IS481 family transposase [Thioalkalivibrio sp. ALE17]